MGALTFFAYASLGLAPGFVFFVMIIAQKSFLTLLMLFSAFLWLIVMLITSAIFRGFVPINETQASYAGVLIASVAIQEAARYGIWYMHRKTVTVLKGMAAANGHRFWLVDQLYMALAWGFGHAACHTTFFFASILPLTAGSGTYYIGACPEMSMFLIGALYSLAFGMLLTSLMVIFLDGMESRSWYKVTYVPVAHLGASMLTLGNYLSSGCMVAMPVLIVFGAAHVALAVRIAWAKGHRSAE